MYDEELACFAKAWKIGFYPDFGSCRHTFSTLKTMCYMIQGIIIARNEGRIERIVSIHSNAISTRPSKFHDFVHTAVDVDLKTSFQDDNKAETNLDTHM